MDGPLKHTPSSSPTSKAAAAAASKSSATATGDDMMRQATTDEVVRDQFQRLQEGKLEIDEYHDELVGHGRVATYRLTIRTAAVATWERPVTGELYGGKDLADKKWMAPIKLEVLSFVKKISESTRSTKASRIVGLMLDQNRLEKVCREVHERDSATGNAFDRLFFFCSSTIYILEAQIDVRFAVFWSFENDYRTMTAMQKVDAVKLEREYQSTVARKPEGSRTCTAVGAFGREYEYDFDKMTQINTHTKKTRKIARRAPTTSAALGAALNNSTAQSAAVKRRIAQFNAAESVRAPAPAYVGAPKRAAAANAAGHDSQSDAKQLLLEAEAESSKMQRELMDEEEKQKQEIARKIELRKKRAAQKKQQQEQLSSSAGDAASGRDMSPSPSSEQDEDSRRGSTVATVAAAPAAAAAAGASTAGFNTTSSSSTNLNSSTALLNTSTALPDWLAELQQSDGIAQDVLQELHSQRVDENTFLLLGAADLQALGIPLGPRLALMRVVERKKKEQEEQEAAKLSSSSNGGNKEQPTEIVDPVLNDMMNKLNNTFHKKTQVFDTMDVELLAPIASGGFGSVYEALLFGQRPVAAKMFAEDGFEGGVEEALFLANLHHRNIVSLVGVALYCPRSAAMSRGGSSTGASSFIGVNNSGSGDAAAGAEAAQTQARPSTATSPVNLRGLRTQPRLLMLLELADGSLSNVLQQAGDSLDFDLVVRYATQIAQALEYLHKQKLVHRDIKCSNVLCISDGMDLHLKLCDMGLSKSVQQTIDVTRRGGAGSFGYMAPEQALSNVVSAAADIFSFGVILSWLLTGVNPLTVLPEDRRQCAEQSSGLFIKLVREKKRPGCPAWLINIAIECLQKDPRARPQSGVVLMEKIEKNAAEFRRLASLAAAKSSNDNEDDAEGVTEAMRGITLSGSGWF